MMNSKYGIIIVVGAIILLASGLILFLGPATQPGSSRALSGVEVRSYEGKDLSSINDFRENSIRGPSTSISPITGSPSPA